MLPENKTASLSEKAEKISVGIARAGHWVILAFLLLISVILCVQSLLYTTVMRNEEADPSAIYYHDDNILINISAIVLLLLCGVFFLRRLLTKINPTIFGTALLMYVIIVGFVWNVLTKCTPAHDSYFIVTAAESIAKGDFSQLIYDENAYNYFYLYPFQLGYTLLCELTYYIFGANTYFALQIINVLSVAAIYAAILVIVKLAFGRREVVNLTTLLLFGCLPPILFSTFHYGNLTGFAFSIWAVVFTCLWIKKRKVVFVPLTAVFIGIGTVLKTNSLIVLVAICLLLLLDLLKNCDVRSLAAIIMSAALGVSLNSLVITSYEMRADVNFGEGIPKILWLDMGLNESENPDRPGWYMADRTVGAFYDSGMDPDIAAEKGFENIKNRIGEFADNPSYCGKFFWGKTMSQWNDPMYMSIWVCSTRTEAPNDFIQSMYYGSAGIMTENYADVYQSIAFVFALSGIVFIIIRKEKRHSIYCAAIPLVTLGGFLYHLLFEAMPQYNLIYFILFVPLAAYGLYALSETLSGLIKRKKTLRINEGNEINQTENEEK